MIDRKLCKRNAKAQIKGNLGMLIVIELLMLIMAYASSMFLIPLALLGHCLVYIGLGYGCKPSVSGLFSRVDCYGKALLLNLLISVFTFLWSLLLIVPGLIKALSYSMAPYILAENPHMSANDALHASMSLTNGHKWELFKLSWSFFGWLLLCMLTFGIGLIYVVPYMEATYANYYRYLIGKPLPKTE